jgi:hypothetical protein
MDRQAHAQSARKDASSLWVLEATAVMQQSAGQTAHGSDLHLFRGHVWRGSVEHDEAVKDKMSAVVKKALRSILAPSQDCSSDVLRDTGLLPVLIDAAKLCWQHRCSEHGGWPMAQEALRFSFEVAVVSAGLRWARTGAVMSNPLLSRSSTP